MGAGKEPLLILGILCMTGKCLSNCPWGQNFQRGKCEDVNECEETENVCGNYTSCVNTNGSYRCQCLDGFRNVVGNNTFTGLHGQCRDNNECIDLHYVNVCGHGHCTNLIGSYKCTCHFGYTNNMDSRGPCKDINECDEAKEKNEDLCGVNGTCENNDGSYYCKCQTGFTNYGNERTSCTKLECDSFDADIGPAPSFEGLEDILFLMRNSCLALSTQSVAGESDGEALLERLFTATETILSSGHLDSRGDMSRLLGTVEDAIMLIGPQLKDNHTKLETNKTDAEIIVRRGKTRPTGPIHLTNGNDTLITDWTTAAGTGPYLGFAMAALLSYKNIDTSVNHSFEHRTKFRKNGVDPTFQVSSLIVSVVVSNPSTQNLSRPVNIIFRHLQDTNTSEDVEYICVYWSKNLTWSQDGCYRNQSSARHTTCTCNHLSSFAVLMAVYPVKNSLALQVLTKIGLIISLLCLVLCILTFKFCRSIQGTRTTIHLHLCICLFLADLFFLTGISQTKPVGGCRFVAAMLHFFFLGVFSWMLLEGVQLYRMVVLVFNATIRPLYLFVFGYGTPLLIVVVSAIVRPSGYGTDQHCWLSLEDGLIWSFFGPVCLIIILNVFFFIITVWRLAQKFSSLNPDLSKLHKIKAFTVTAIAQMCILGLMWVFGAFLLQEGSTALEYIFTILNSLQGALIFVMHCLLSKQVRDEYAHFLSCIICTPQKKKYSEMSSTNPSSSQSQASRSLQNTGESQI